MVLVGISCSRMSHWRVVGQLGEEVEQNMRKVSNGIESEMTRNSDSIYGRLYSPNEDGTQVSSK